MLVHELGMHDVTSSAPGLAGWGAKRGTPPSRPPAGSASWARTTPESAKTSMAAVGCKNDT